MLKQLLTTVALAGLISAPSVSAQEEAQGLGDAIIAGKAHVNFRYRYEFVAEDDFDEDANASTLRFRLNYETKKWRGWSAFGEFDYVGHLLMKDFNSGAGTSPDKTQYPVVADPKGADLNQLYLDYNGFADTRLRLGRQRILLDNQRFVGGVGWRQQEQTFDGFSAKIDSLPRTELFYSYVGRVNTIFGERSGAGHRDMNTHLLNGAIKLTDKWKVTPYYYYIDDEDVSTFSTGTFGARVNGDVAVGEGSIKLVGEVATQSDVADNAVGYSAQYYHLDALWGLKNGLSFGLGIESLGGDENDAGKAFRTPLATLHKFQGWADQFLGTGASLPQQGVVDLYGSVKYKYQKWNFQAIYHDFSAAAGSGNWGSEFDIAAGRSFGERYGLLLKGAFFKADDGGFDDATKIWLQLVANY